MSLKLSFHRKMFCPTCKSSIDRDINVAKNILLRSTRAVPNGTVDDAVMTEPGSRQPVICRVDAVKSGHWNYLSKLVKA